MNALSIHYPTDQLANITPAMPQEVQQLACQLVGQTQQVLDNCTYYGLLLACLTAAMAFLFSSLLLVLYAPSVKLVQPKPRLNDSTARQQPSKRPVENRIATDNRNELRLMSSRLRAGQLSN